MLLDCWGDAVPVGRDIWVWRAFEVRQYRVMAYGPDWVQVVGWDGRSEVWGTNRGAVSPLVSPDEPDCGVSADCFRLLP